MNFTKTPIDWKNKGTEPSSDIKTSGFTAGYKPPAEYHNYLFANAADCIKEVQEKLSDVIDNQDALPIKSLAGQTVNPISSMTVTAQTGATIICDLRDRAFNDNTVATGNVAMGSYSVAMGTCTTAIGASSTASGYRATASGTGSVAMGNNATASGERSVAMGGSTTASGTGSVAMGNNATASGSYSVAMGNNATASGTNSVAFGLGSTALGYQFKIGHYAKDGTAGASSSTTGDAFTIGNGTTSTPNNAFRVTYEGKAYGLSAYGSSGADYAEYFEWTDGNPNNEDRRGKFVTLDGEKIRFATSDDNYILGVISATPCVEGDNFSEDWQGKYLTDVFGQKLTQTVHVPAKYETVETVDPETGETTTEQVLIEEEHDEIQWVLNPDFDDTKEYVSREFRKEWSPVGMIGKLVVVDNGTCEVNGYCKAGENGIATKADSGYRVLSRIDDTHIRVLIK